MNIIIAAYCTRGAYEEEARKLKASLDKLKLFYIIKPIDSLGSWQQNCLYKPTFIKETMAKFDLPVLYVDADAVFYKFPELIYNLEHADAAIHYFNNIQLASGTLFFNNTPGAKDLIDAWIERNKRHSHELEQQNLQDVIENGDWRIQHKVTIFNLPAEYCKIFDLTQGVVEPVIEHFQASRRLRNEVDVTAIEKDKYKEQWNTGYVPSRCAIFLGRFIYEKSLPGEKLLDIGCGNGMVTRDLTQMGHQCTGLDITLAGITGDRSGFIEAPVWRMPFKDSEFDMTFSTDTLEHLPEELVETAILEIFRVTKNESKHVIATFPHEKDGEQLHLTVKPISWWQEKFNRLNTKGIDLEIIDRKDFLARMER